MSKKENVPAATGGAVAPFDYGAETGSGFEDTKRSDMAIPFLNILQGLSPQITEGTVDGAKPGMFYNNVTHELIDGKTGFVFLPTHHFKAFVEWVPRDSGGGFVGMYKEEDPFVQECIKANGGSTRKMKTPEGNDLQDTYYVYGLMLDDTGSEIEGAAVLSFKVTGIKPYRNWITAMNTIKGRPPLVANRVRIRTALEKRKAGPSFNYVIDPLNGSWIQSLIDPAKERPLLEEAIAFRNDVKSGVVGAKFDQQKQADPVEDGDDEHTPGF